MGLPGTKHSLFNGDLTFGSIDWIVAPESVPYLEACDWMEKRVLAIREGSLPEALWLVEHPDCYTLGVRGQRGDVLANPQGFPVYSTGRGGQVTYHGPGQRVVYAMVDLRKRQIDVRSWVRFLEAWQVATLKALGVEAFPDPEAIGLWVETQEGRRKIASIGIRIRRGVSYHGFALNVSTNLEAFRHITACGLEGDTMTSLERLKKGLFFEEVDAMLKKVFVHQMVQWGYACLS